MIFRSTITLLFICATALSCTVLHQPNKVEWQRIGVSADQANSGNIEILLAPYHDSLAGSMNIVIGEIGETLTKGNGESTLGNFVADALLYAGRQNYPKADIALMNRGGYRLNEISRGPITVGKAFELMPFDNLLLCIAMSGSQLFDMFEKPHFTTGGWPIAGATLIVHEGKLQSVLVNGQALQKDATYYIIVSDYLASGGDEMNLFKNLPVQNANYLQRDAVIDYIKFMSGKGMAIKPPLLNRVQ